MVSHAFCLEKSMKNIVKVVVKAEAVLAFERTALPKCLSHIFSDLGGQKAASLATQQGHGSFWMQKRQTANCELNTGSGF